MPLQLFQIYISAKDKLGPVLPPTSLMSPKTLANVILQCVNQIFFVIAIVLLAQKWETAKDYKKCVINTNVKKEENPCTENTAIFILSCCQYLSCCIALNMTHRFR